MQEEAKGWLVHVAFQALMRSPERLTRDGLDRLTSLLRSPGLDAEILGQAGQVMNFLVSSHLAGVAIGKR